MPSPPGMDMRIYRANTYTFTCRPPFFYKLICCSHSTVQVLQVHGDLLSKLLRRIRYVYDAKMIKFISKWTFHCTTRGYCVLVTCIVKADLQEKILMRRRSSSLFFRMGVHWIAVHRIVVSLFNHFSDMFFKLAFSLFATIPKKTTHRHQTQRH